MTNAALTISTLGLKPLSEVHQLPFCPQAAELLLPVHRSDAGGVVAAVFQLPQTFQQQGVRCLGANEGDDSAHGVLGKKGTDLGCKTCAR